MGTSLWLPGVVAAHHVRANGRTLPYMVNLDRGDTCYAQIDRSDLLRAEADEEEFAWNGRTHAMEVAATASLVIDPSNCRLAIGMFHDHAAAGALRPPKPPFCRDVPVGVSTRT